MTSCGSARMELFLREKFRPPCAPGRGHRLEIIRSDPVVFGTHRGQHPRLGAFHEHMGYRNQPRRVVERAGAKVDDLRTSRPVTAKPAAAISAKPGYDRHAARRSMAPCLHLTFQNMKILGKHRHIERERAAGRPLAIGAIAGVEQQRKRRDLVTDRAARTAAGHRRCRSRHAHDQPRWNTRREYPENERAATPIFPQTAIAVYRFSMTRL
jgi:hypothetical protein